MPINKRVGSAQEALADVRDGSTVMISGFGGAGFRIFSFVRCAIARRRI